MLVYMPEAVTLPGQEAPVAAPAMPAVEAPAPQLSTIDTSSLQTAVPRDALQGLVDQGLAMPAVENQAPSGVLAQAEQVAAQYIGAETSVAQALNTPSVETAAPVVEHSPMNVDAKMNILKAAHGLSSLLVRELRRTGADIAVGAKSTVRYAPIAAAAGAAIASGMIKF